MVEKKKQHFVPQFYMRNFSADPGKRFFSLYHLDSGKRIDGVPIKDQNYHDYFYGKDGKIEDALAILEHASSVVIARVLADDALPERMSEEFVTLHLFVLFQANRTAVSAKQLDEQLGKYVKELARDEPQLKDSVEELRIGFNNAPAQALKIAAQTSPFTLDLKWKLLLNRTSQPYITSDHPVVLYNQFLETRKQLGSNIGLTAKGLQIFYPLGPRHLLMMYDGDSYRVGGRKHLEPNTEVADSDVSALNALQAANADECLFFSPETSPIHVASAVDSGRQYHIDESTSVERYEPLSEETGELIHISRMHLRAELVLPSVGVIPSAAGAQISNHVVQLRDPTFVRLCEDFCAQVEAGRYKSSQFGDYMRDRFASC